MLVNSLKPLEEIRQGGMLALPQQWTIAPWLSGLVDRADRRQPTGLRNPIFMNSMMMVVPAVAHLDRHRRAQRLCLTKWRFKGDRTSSSA
jgi:glucose/mannose transport system permease protein